MPEHPARVRKRDGRELRFDLVGLTASIEAALEATGGSASAAPFLAEAVAGVLADPPVVETSLLARAVEKALRLAGFEEAARAFREWREERAGALGLVRVHTRERGRDSARPWDRERLALSLVRDRHLESSLAWELAHAVERRILESGLRHLTARLVAALAENEMRTLGLRGDSPSTERVGLERRQLHAWLGGDCLPTVLGTPRVGPAAGPIRSALGGEILARFALEDILSAPAAEALRAGRYDLPALGDWLRAVRLTMAPRPEEGEEAFWQRVAAARGVARELRVCWPRGRSSSSLSREAPGWLGGLEARLCLQSSEPRLALDWARRGHWVRVPLSAYFRATSAEQEDLAARERILLVWGAGRGSWCRPGRRRLDGCAVLNLAGHAEGRESLSGAFLEALEETLDLACEALQQLHVRSGPRDRESPARVVLLPAGLPQALARLYPGLPLDADPVRRLLLSLHSAFTRAARRAGLRHLELAPPLVDGSGARLAASDAAADTGAYAVGWNPDPGSSRPPAVAFATAPWLEFPAAAALAVPGLLRSLPATGDAAS